MRFVSPFIAWPVDLVAGAAVAAVTWRAMRETFAQPLFARRNYRGIDVPVGAGVLVVVAGLVVTGLWTVVDALGVHTAAPIAVPLMLAAGFSLLGLLDDLAAHGDDRGFAGHLRALRQGRLTTGGLKLLAGGMLSLIVAGPVADGRSLPRLLVAAALISLAANLGNLFDRAPGRCVKVALVAAAVLCASAGAADRFVLEGVVIVIGAAVGLGWFDLREQLMLGDAGSNVLGAVVGWGVVATTGLVVQCVVLAALLALNLLSEKVSFSRVIDAVGPLRAVDRLGRPVRWFDPWVATARLTGRQTQLRPPRVASHE